VERGSHGAVVGPLVGARAPQRVSTPPSSGLAVAPLGLAQRAANRIGASSPAPAKKPVRLFFFRAGEGSSDEP